MSRSAFGILGIVGLTLSALLAGTSAAVAGTLSPVSITNTGMPEPVLAGADLTYTITAGNNSAGALKSATLADPLPAGTTFVSLAAPAGWSCTTPAVGAGGAVSCTVAPFATGNAVFTLVVQVGAATPPGTVQNPATLTATDSGRSATATATASNTVVSPATVSGTKSVSGSFTPGGTVTYTLVLTNGGPATQADNPGHELTDVLPAGLILTGATASSGVAAATPPTRTVTWDGSIPAGGSVTLTITATVSGLPAGTTFANQGTIAYDADGDGTNEAAAMTDDPALPGAADPTVFQIPIGDPGTGIPTLDSLGLALLALLLAVGGATLLRRRRTPA